MRDWHGPHEHGATHVLGIPTHTSTPFASLEELRRRAAIAAGRPTSVLKFQAEGERIPVAEAGAYTHPLLSSS
jgi:hypothetical protein